MWTSGENGCNHHQQGSRNQCGYWWMITVTYSCCRLFAADKLCDITHAGKFFPASVQSCLYLAIFMAIFTMMHSGCSNIDMCIIIRLFSIPHTFIFPAFIPGSLVQQLSVLSKHRPRTTIIVARVFRWKAWNHKERSISAAVMLGAPILFCPVLAEGSMDVAGKKFNKSFNAERVKNVWKAHLLMSAWPACAEISLRGNISEPFYTKPVESFICSGKCRSLVSGCHKE